MGAGYRMLSYGGSYTQDGLKKGMNENQAAMYGETMAGMETLMDTLGDKLKGVAIGKAKTTTGFKNFVKTGLKELGINATVEGLGEAVTEPIQELVATAFGGKADYDNIGERMWQSFLGGFASEALMTGASLGYGGSINAYNKIRNGEEITLDELKDALKEIDQKDEVDLEKMLVNNFNFTADELYRNTDVQQNREEKLGKIAEELSNEEKRQIMINESDLDDDQKEVLSEIATQFNLSDKDVKKAIENTKQGKYTQNNEVLQEGQQTIQDESKMAQNETSQQSSEYTTNLMKSIDNYNNSRQEKQEIFDINNEETRKEIESIQKVAEKRGINITFDENRFNNTDTNAFYEYDKDGNVANIVLNPNSTSKKYVQNLVIHEMTHSFEGSKQYKSLSKAILDYAKKTGEYDKAFQDLKNTYSSIYKGNNIDSIVEKEAVANILGEKLGDKEFVDSLVNNQYVERNIIQKIIDFAKNQINRFKGYKDQEQYWNNIKNLYEEAYNKSEVSKEGLKQSVETNKDKIQKHKEEQLEIVKETNPMWDEEHVGIRKVEDIQTFEECIKNAEEDGAFVWGDYTEEDAKRDLARGKVTIYSSYPIKNGVFVSTSYQQAYEYAGHDASKVHQRTVNLDSVAWINGDEGQYAKVKPKVDENKAYQKMIDDVANSLRVTNKTNELDIYSKARQLASNEFKKLTTDEDYDNYNKRIEEIEKDLTERLSQEDTNIKYSQDTTGAWNNFIEKYFKNEGEGTAIKDLKKLPTREYTIQDYEEVINNSANIPETDKQAIMKDLEGIELNKKSLEDFKQYVTDLDKNYAEYNAEQEQNRFENKNYKDESRAELISKKRKEFNKSTEYDDTVVSELDEIIPRNRNGKRTVAQWKNMAKQLGQRIANLSPEQIEDIAVKSYYDLEPTKAITRYDNQSKTNVGYEQLYANDWVNSVYEGVRENRQYSIDTENQVEQPTQETELPKAKKVLNPTEISNLTPEIASTTPELPNKTYKEGSKVSNFISNIENDVGFLTDAQKQDILKEDNVKYYAPVTNADTLAKAYDNLKENGQEATYEWYAKKSDNATAEDVATGWILLKQYADKGDTKGMVNVAKKLRDMGTKAGQTVQAFNILSRLTPEGMVAYTQSELQDAYNEMIKGKTKKWIDQHKADFDLTQEEVAFIMDTMQNLPEENLATNNYERKVALGQIQKLFTDKMPTENSKIKSWMRISMLFNPKTQVRNIAGNAGVIPVNMVSDFLGSKADKFISKYTGVRTLGNPNVKSYLKGMKDGFYQSYNDFRQGINTRDIEQNRFEFGQGKAFSDKGLGKALNSVDNMLNFVMDFGDRGFYQASFVNSLNNQMLLNGTTTPTQDMIDIATQEALSRTWNDNNEYTNFVLGIRRWLNKMVGTKNYGLGDVLIPFAKTPANLTKAIVEYSPVGLTKSILDIPNIKNAIETGQMTAQQQHQFADHLGKGLAGTMLYVLGYALANAGITTGEPDKDKDVKNFMRYSLGISPYSVKIGDKSFTYDWSQPVATPLAIMSNLAQQNQKNPDASLLDKTLSAVNIGTNQLLEQSFMESLNEVLNGNGDITERLTKAVFDLPARAIPTFSKQIADLVDGTQRTSFEYGEPSQTAINSIKAKLPVKSEELASLVDTLGNDIQKYGGENNWFNVFFNPANMNKGQTSKEAEEIYRVYEETGDTTVFPITAPYYIDKDGSRINMDSQTRAEYQRTTGNYTKSIVKELLNDKDYKKLSDPDKAKVLKQVVTDSNEKAKRDVLNINNDSSDLDLIDKVGADYYTYKLAEKGKDKIAEKSKILADKNYSNKNKQLIYESEINKDDKAYQNLKKINKNFDMDAYLDFRTQTFSGKHKKDNMLNYLKNSGLSREEQLVIQGKEYKLNNAERSELERLLRNKMPSKDIIDVLQNIK